MGSGVLRRGLAFAFGVVIVLAAPGVAHATGAGLSFFPQTTTQPPVIDGVLGATEWQHAGSFPLDFSGHPGTVMLMHDSNYLYIAATITDSGMPAAAEFTTFFDNNNDGIQNGSDAMSAFVGSPSSQGNNDFYYSATGTGGASYYPDNTNGGSMDVVGAGTVTGSTVTFELRKPLCSGDPDDFCLSILGGTLGVDFQYDSLSSFYRYPSADVVNPSFWGDLPVGTPQYGCSTSASQIFNNWTGGATANGATQPTFSTGGAFCLTQLETYHWNSGLGDAPAGTIGVDVVNGLGGPPGTHLGPWPATASAATGGVYADWTANVTPSTPPVVINGSYKCNDSHPSTWSYDPAASTDGFCRVNGKAATALDDVPPAVSLTSPSAGSMLNGTVTVSADASDNYGVQSVHFQFYNGSTYTDLGTLTSPPYSVRFDTTTVPNCGALACTVYATARDTSNNTRTVGNGVGVSNSTVAPDTTPPTATMTAPIAGATVSGLVWLGGSVSDPGTGASGVATWTFQDAAAATPTAFSDISGGTGAGEVAASWGTEGSGDYYLRLKAVDNAGNTGFSSPVLVHVDNAHPDTVLKVDATGDFTESSFGTLDPANTNLGLASYQVLDATCLHLVRHRDAAGAAGFQLEPDAATWSDAGHQTYVFTIRSGLTFSDGTPVTPNSFVTQFERLASPTLNPPSSPGFGGYFDEIQGAPAYNAGTAPTISGLSVSGSNLTITLTKPDGAFLAKLASPYACAVPETTPLDMIVPNLPAAGPYFVASYVPGHQLVLNARDNGLGRPHAFGEIVYKLNVPATTADAEVLSGAADYTTGVASSDESSLNGSVGPGSTAAAAGNQQLFIDPVEGVQFVALNAERTLFADPVVRKAFNVALDRAALVSAFGLHTTFTDQLLTSNVPGFSDQNIYDPKVTDFTAAKDAVAAKGFGGATVEVLGCTGPEGSAVAARCAAVDSAVTTTLTRIGLVAHITDVSRPVQIQTVTTRPFNYDITQIGWIADYPDPQGMLQSLVDGRTIHDGPSNSNFSYFNDATVNAELDSADANTDTTTRFDALGQADVSIMTNQAPYAPFGAIQSLDLVSTRVLPVDAWYGPNLAAFHLRITPTVGGVTTNAGGTVPAGAAATPTGAIPISSVSGALTKSTGIDGIGIDGIGIDGIGIDGIGIDGIGIDGIGIDGIGIDGIDLQQNGLGGVPLSQIPLIPPKSWDQLLQGTALANVPIVDLTLADVFQSAPGVLTNLHLGSIDLSNSPLGKLPIAAVALGTVGIDGIPIDGHTGTQNDADWCTVIHSVPGFSGFDCSLIPSTTLMGLALKGVGIDGIGIGGIGIDGIDLSSSPLRNISLDSVKGNLAASGIDGIGIDGIDFSKSPLANISLDALTPASRDAVVNCSTTFACAGQTLGAAFTAGAIKPGATVGDLSSYPGVNLGNLGNGMPPSVTLNELLSLLLPTIVDWSQLPAGFPLNDYATSGGVVTFTVPFRLTGAATGTANATVTVKLSNGARFQPGSAIVSSGLALDAPTTVQSGDVETVKWTVHDVPIGVGETLTFKAHAGQVLGSDSATVSVDVGGQSATAAPASFTVGDTFEPNDTAGSATSVDANTLYESYITSATERDYFTLPNPPAGTIVKVKLNRLPADYDLVMYGPATPPLRSAGIDGIGIDGIGIDGIPVGDSAQTLQQQSQQLGTETLHDVPTDGGLSGQVVVGTSSTRGTAPEEIDYVSTGQTGNLTIQVTSYNGSFSATQPYTLSIEKDAPPPPPPCAPMFPSTAPLNGSAGTMPSIGGNVSTLILTNEKQLGDMYGATAEQNVVNAANSLISQGYGGPAALVPVESDPNVAAAYAAWDADPCSPSKANDVVRAIGALLDNISSGRPIQNIMILGSDQIVPMARLVDPNAVANEAAYAGTIGVDSGNELLAAAANHMFLSDDPYAASPTPYNGGYTYRPSLGLSRVVETPAEIVNQITQFNNAKGRLNPTTEFVSGYDFLTDDAQAVSSVLHAQGRTGSSDLINESWTASQFDSAMFPSTSPPAENVPNAHYDNFRLLPADQNAAHLNTNLYSTSQLVAHGAGSTNGRLVFTVGCHSGWNAPDTIFGSTAAKALDWAQAYTGRTGAAMFEGNTGFGYGDTVTVAYSEALQVDFAKRLDGTLNIGRALSFAKQDYWGALGPMFTNYDAKVMGEATEYGIGLYRLGSGTPPAPSAPAATFTDSATGLTATSFDFTPTFEPHSTPFGTYYTVGGNSFSVNRRPIEPVMYADATEPGLTAHGASFTINTSNDISPFDPVFDRLVAASGTPAGELVGLTTFPTNLVDVRTIDTPNGRQQKVVFTPAMFLSDTIPDAAGVGTQRLFDSSSVKVYYSASKDFTKPDVGPIAVDRVGSSLVGFSVHVTDTDPTGGTPQVKRVFVNYLDGTTWRKIDLGSANGTDWSGAGPLGGTATTYFLEAIDAAGNVSVVADKGQTAPAVAPTSSGGVTVTVTGTTVGDWFTSAATATFSSSVTYSLDGGALTDGSTVQVSGDGVHTLTYSGIDGSTGTVVIPIDTTAPTITINDRGYLLGSTGNAFDIRCADAGSGVASCTPTPATPDTSTVGAHTVSVHAVDRVNNAADASGTYHVFWPFRGFFSPISNLPVLNQANSGQSIPVKFSLNGDRGLAVLASGSPNSKQIACESTAPLSAAVTTSTSGSSGLTYDSTTDTYTYVWKTDKAWAGTCRQLDVALSDGSHHVANFTFK
ncbi:MAG: ABC transporter substrate-binding protein [Gaiellaceae bacterium]